MYLILWSCYCFQYFQRYFLKAIHSSHGDVQEKRRQNQKTRTKTVKTNRGLFSAHDAGAAVNGDEVAGFYD